jgi:phage terminase large subunit-like protein
MARTSRHFIWLDEEPPEDVYDEALIRATTVNGLMMVTFTPLKGLSAVAMRFLPHPAPTLTP